MESAFGGLTAGGYDRPFDGAQTTRESVAKFTDTLNSKIGSLANYVAPKATNVEKGDI